MGYSHTYKSKWEQGRLTLSTFGVILMFLFFLQQHVDLYKAAVANKEKMVVLEDGSGITPPGQIGFFHNELRSYSLVTDPITKADFNEFSYLKIVEEIYCRLCKRDRWRQRGSFLVLADTAHGDTRVSSTLLDEHSKEVVSGPNLENLQNQKFRDFFVAAQFETNHVYLTEVHRYRYSAITNPLQVTIIGQIESGISWQQLGPSPLLPSNYPAIWPGYIAPEEFIGTLRTRMLNIIAAMSGLMIGAGWLMFAAIWKMRRRPKELPQVYIFCSALFSGSAAMLFFYTTASALYCMLSWVGFLLLFYNNPFINKPARELSL